MKRTLKVLAVVLVVAMLAVAGVISVFVDTASTGVQVIVNGEVLKTTENLEDALALAVGMNVDTVTLKVLNSHSGAALKLDEAGAAGNKALANLEIDLNGKTYTVEATAENGTGVALNFATLAGDDGANIRKVTIKNGAILAANASVQKEVGGIPQFKDDGSKEMIYTGVNTLIANAADLTLANVTLGAAENNAYGFATIIDATAGSVKVTGTTRIISAGGNNVVLHQPAQGDSPAVDVPNVAINLSANASFDSTGLTETVENEVVVDEAGKTGKISGAVKFVAGAKLTTGDKGIYKVALTFGDAVTGEGITLGKAINVDCLPTVAAGVQDLGYGLVNLGDKYIVEKKTVVTVDEKGPFDEGYNDEAVRVEGLSYLFGYTPESMTVVTTGNDYDYVISDVSDSTPTGGAKAFLSLKTDLEGRVAVTKGNDIYVVTAKNGWVTLEITGNPNGNYSLSNANDEIELAVGETLHGNGYTVTNTYNKALKLGYYEKYDRYALGVFTITTKDSVGLTWPVDATADYEELVAKTSQTWQRYPGNDIEILFDVSYADMVSSLVPKVSGNTYVTSDPIINKPKAVLTTADATDTVCIPMDAFKVIYDGCVGTFSVAPATIDASIFKIPAIDEVYDATPYVLAPAAGVEEVDTTLTNGKTVSYMIYDKTSKATDETAKYTIAWNSGTDGVTSFTNATAGSVTVKYCVKAQYHETIYPSTTVKVDKFDIADLTISLNNASINFDGLAHTPDLAISGAPGSDAINAVTLWAEGDTLPEGVAKGDYKSGVYTITANAERTEATTSGKGTEANPYKDDYCDVVLEAHPNCQNYTGKATVQWQIKRVANTPVAGEGAVLGSDWNITSTSGTWTYGDILGEDLKVVATGVDKTIFYTIDDIEFRWTTEMEIEAGTGAHVYKNWSVNGKLPIDALEVADGKYYISFRINDNASHTGYGEDEWSEVKEFNIAKANLSTIWATELGKPAADTNVVQPSYTNDSFVFDGDDQIWPVADYYAGLGDKFPETYLTATSSNDKNEITSIVVADSAEKTLVVTYSFKNYQNYQVTYKMVIKPMPVEIEVDSADLIYNGAAQYATYTVKKAGTKTVVDFIKDYPILKQAKLQDGSLVISSFTKPSEISTAGNNAEIKGILKLDPNTNTFVVDSDMIEGNYTVVSYKAGRITMAPKTIKITLDSGLTEDYDGSEHVWVPVIIGPSVNSQSAGSDNIQLDIVNTTIKSVDATEIPITKDLIKLTGSNLDCYTIEITNSVVFKVNKREITFTIGLANQAYGTPVADIQALLNKLTEEKVNPSIWMTNGDLIGSAKFDDIDAGAWLQTNYPNDNATADVYFDLSLIKVTDGAKDVTKNYTFKFTEDTIKIISKALTAKDTINFVWEQTSFVYNMKEQRPILKYIEINGVKFDASKIVDNGIVELINIDWSNIEDMVNVTGVKEFVFLFTGAGYHFTDVEYALALAAIDAISDEDMAYMAGLGFTADTTKEELEAFITTSKVVTKIADNLRALLPKYTARLDAEAVIEALTCTYEITPYNVNVDSFTIKNNSYVWTAGRPTDADGNIIDFFTIVKNFKDADGKVRDLKVWITWGGKVGSFYAVPEAVDCDHPANYYVNCNQFIPYTITPDITVVPGFVAMDATIGNDYALNFKVNKDFIDMYGKEFVLNFESDVLADVTISKLNDVHVKVEGDYYVFSYTNITPANMNAMIYATLVVNGEEYAADGYSLATYCYKLLDIMKGTPNRWINATVALLRYGAEAQKYDAMTKNTTVAAEDLVTYKLDNDVAYADMKLIDTKKPGALDTFKTADLVVADDYKGKINSYVSVLMDNGASIKYSISIAEGIDETKLSINGYTLDDEDMTLQTEIIDGVKRYYVVCDVFFVNASADNTFEVKVGDDTAVTLTYSIENYAAAPTAAQALTKALVDFGYQLKSMINN